MPRRRYLFDIPDRFVAGTIGEPGSRTFFLQARDRGRLVSVALEKVQVAVLAERLNELLDELERRGVTVATTDATQDQGPLDEPLQEAFRAASLTLGWSGDDGVVLIEARAGQDDDEEEAEPADDDEEGPDVMTVRLTASSARSFVDRAVRVIASGRPPCPLCGQPLDATGHICPRQNGHYLN